MRVCRCSFSCLAATQEDARCLREGVIFQFSAIVRTEAKDKPLTPVSQPVVPNAPSFLITTCRGAWCSHFSSAASMSIPLLHAGDVADLLLSCATSSRSCQEGRHECLPIHTFLGAALRYVVPPDWRPSNLQFPIPISRELPD